MSTRSYILEEQEDGTYKGVYCHCDGYLTYNGAMLLDHYATKERVEKLISMGNLSSLHENIEPDPSLPHDFNDRQKDVCVFYGRDRGEKGQEAMTMDLKDIDDPSSWIEYCYVFGKDGRWRYFECGHLGEGLKDLQTALDEEYTKLGFPRPKGYYGFYTEDDIKKLRYDYAKSQQAEM
ncbi:MAG: hypothetical protein PUE07_05125 [bacterium]|nr:hypothetical protein [bacterium]